MADPGERLGGAWAPALFLDQTKARGVEKIFWTPAPPLYLRIWIIAPPPPLLTSRSGSGTVILQYVTYAVTLRSHGRAEAGGHKEEHILLLKVH